MKEEIHIGKLIKKKMDEDGRKTKWLADKIHCNRNNIYRIYQQQHIDFELLLRICLHLEIDLFINYSEYLRELIKEKNSKL